MTGGGLGGGVPLRPTEEGGPHNVWSNGRFVSFEEYQKRNIQLGKYGGSAAAPRGSTAAQVGGLGPQAESVFSVIVPDATLAIIPGVGADCGHVDRFSKRLVRCSIDSDHDSYEVGGSSCGRPGCPRHWKTWARRGADRIGRVVWGYKQASKGRHNPRHTILSVDDEDEIVQMRIGKSDAANLRYFRKYFAKRAIDLGGIGGSLIVHLLRTNDDVPIWIQDERRWDWVRKQPDWRRFTKFSPHAHILGYGFYDRYKEGEFLYKNMPALEKRDDVESVAYYGLSHAPIGVGNAVVYWGCCQPGCMRVLGQGVSLFPVYCSKCGAPMIYDDCGDEYLRKRSWAVYECCELPVRAVKKRGPRIPRVRTARQVLIWGITGPPVSAQVIVL